VCPGNGAGGSLGNRESIKHIRKGGGKVNSPCGNVLLLPSLYFGKTKGLMTEQELLNLMAKGIMELIDREVMFQYGIRSEVTDAEKFLRGVNCTNVKTFLTQPSKEF